MSTLYAQTIYDTGLGAYVRYTLQYVTNSPDPAVTIPTGVGPFDSSTHKVIAQTQDQKPQVWYPVATIGDLPANASVVIGDTCYVVAEDAQYVYNGVAWIVNSGGGGGETVLWEWIGTDDSQFALSNPLPAPATTSGVVTGPELTVVADAQSVLQNDIALYVDAIAAGGATWWMDTPVPLASIKYIEMEFGYPFPGPDPTSTEMVQYGLIIGGDADTGHAIAVLASFQGTGLGDVEQHIIVNQVDPVGPTVTVLVDDTLPGFAYGLTWRINVNMARNNTMYAGGTGVPNGSLNAQLTGWVIGPTSGGTFPHSATALFNTNLYPPGPSWATTACNRIGIVVSGNWTATSGGQEMSIGRIRFLG